MKILLRKKYISLSIALLFLLYFAGPLTIRQVTGTPFGSLGMGLLTRVFGLCVCTGLLHIYGKLWYPIPTRHRENVVLKGLPIVLAFLVGALSIYSALPKIRAQRILASAQLAPLPESASQIKVLTWSSPMSGEKYLRFHANPVEIKSFLAQSPILEHAEFEEYSDKRMRLFYPDALPKVSFNDNHKYINKSPSAPSWYMQEIRQIADRYRFLPQGYNHAGELIVQKKTNFVFIKLIIG